MRPTGETAVVVYCCYYFVLLQMQGRHCDLHYLRVLKRLHLQQTHSLKHFASTDRCQEVEVEVEGEVEVEVEVAFSFIALAVGSN